MHRREKDIICLICHKTFVEKLDLRLHVRNVHHKIKNHQCLICEQKFYSTGHLNVHVRQKHGIDKSEPCNICGKVLRKEPMADHIRTHHLRTSNSQSIKPTTEITNKQNQFSNSEISSQTAVG